MKSLTFALLLLVSFVSAAAVEVGDTLERVLAEKGSPVGRMEAGAALVLRYPDMTITLQAGRVTAMKSAADVAPAPRPATTASRPQPKPAPAPAPRARAESAADWQTDYAAALAQAKEQQRKVFLFFTGSDWCGWCKRLDREILSTLEFGVFAQQQLVLVKLDFPRGTKLPPELTQQNDALARKYRVRGFPTVVVLDPEGKAVGRLGYQEGGPQPFIAALEKL